MKIKKTFGLTRTEQLLSKLCDRTFLKLWSFSNPYKADGKELCDLIAVFENHIFIFFDRESRKFDLVSNDWDLAWNRWKKEVIDKQINTANGAERYINDHKPIYLDAKGTVSFPISIPQGKVYIHKIVVAHGAEDACKRFSKDNIYGSLAVNYSDDSVAISNPFIVNLSRERPIHLFDSANLGIILHELDTFFDFTSYLIEKERVIQEYKFLSYCGEEDLLANYFLNYDSSTNTHFIGSKKEKFDCVHIGEGEWADFCQSEPYKRKKHTDKQSYLWDELLQKTCQNALDGTLIGDTPLRGEGPLHEMAKEPRFFRRILAERIMHVVQNFPENLGPIARMVSFFPSYYKDKGYVFLQLKHDHIADYENDYRPKRQEMLQIACGVARNKFVHLNKVIGIAVDAPKFSRRNSEDLMLLSCEKWSEKDITYWAERNKDLKFFETSSVRISYTKAFEFPH